jgi:hypothetical protein
VGFAGRKELSTAEDAELESALGIVLGILGHRLAAIAPGVRVEAGKEPSISRFYARQCPLLRLVTGLCEGADALAAQVLEKVRIMPDPDAVCGPETRCLETELAGVLPFGIETYRKTRPEGFQAEFDRQLASCAWVLALDGIYEKPDPDTASAKNRRARAYRAQSAFLLRHSDLLIAAANPDEPGKAGGTLETVREALIFDLPVVFIHTGTGAVHLIEPQGYLPSALAETAPSAADREKTLCGWVTQLTTAAESELNPGESDHNARSQQGERLLDEYFNHAAMPPRDAGGKRKSTYRERVWTWFEAWFRSGPNPKSDPPLPPYDAYRRRATDLNYHYGGLYRGGFLLNYALAVVAVTLAAGSLALLAIAKHRELPWLLPMLLAFGVVKVGILIFITINTSRARREEWNDRAVDCRYLAERLRGMFYLPRAGSHQPPTASPPQFASRAVRQSAVDWLFDALVRAVSPAEMPHAKLVEIGTYDGRGVLRVKHLLTFEPGEAMAAVRDKWIGEQTNYHERNALTMHALDDWAEKTGESLSVAVVLIVLLDFLLIGGELLNWLPERVEMWAELVTPVLVFVSAVLPAAVATLNGIRFQSECQRLAERSKVFRVILHGRANAKPGDPQGRWQLAAALADRIRAAKSDPATDPGSWSHDALRLIELVASDFVQEAAEWSVLYDKELSPVG